ncbi:MAG: amidohydrolase family protein, partial [Phycisphaerae bacterium]
RAAELRNAIDLQNAGVVWCATSMELGKPAEVLASLHEIIEAGLARDAALAALTTTPASVFGCGDSLGTIEVGKRANLAILNKPLGDKEAKVRWTFVDGRQFDGEEGAKKGRDKDKKDKKDDTKRDDAASKPSESQAASATTQATDAASAPSASAPATTSASAPASTAAPDFFELVRSHEPAWPIETEADRVIATKTGGSVLLKNAHVITVSGDDLLNTDVLVEKGKIAKIGKGLAAAAGVMSIDLAGYVLAPGVIDGHAHIALDSVNEGANSITCEVRCEDVIRSDDVNIYRALAGGVTTMHLMHGSANTIGGECVLVKLKYGGTADDLVIKDRQRTVKWATGENVIRGGKQTPWQYRECCGDRPRRFPGTRMGVEGTMRRALQAGKNYSDARAAQAKELADGKRPLPLRRDVRLEALADIIDGKLWVNCHCYRLDEILRLLNVCEDFGVRVANLHHCLEAYRIIPEILRHGCGTVTFADWWAYKVEAYDAIPHNAGMLMRAGVNSTIKSDSADLMRHMPLEAAKCMKYSGLTPNEALQLVTLNVARQFGLDKRIGSIEVGKDADLAVWEGHPIDTFSKPVLTLVEGEVYFRHRDFDVTQPRGKPRVAVRGFAVQPPTTPENLLRAAAGAGDSKRQLVADAAGVYAITGATVHPVSGPAIAGGTVVIRGGKIEAVGASVATPSGATVIDAKGLHVYPGLINAATQVGLREIEQVDITVDVEETGVFMADLAALSAFNPHSQMVAVTRAEGITSALIVAASNAVAGHAGLVHFDGWTMHEMVGEMKLGMTVSLPFKRPDALLERPEKPDFEGWNERPQRNDRAYQQLAEIQTFFESAKRYAAIKADPTRAATLDIDPRYEAMIPYVRGEKPVLLSADSYKQILEALQFAHALDLQPIIVGGQDAWMLADLLAQLDVPVIYEGVFAGPDGVEGVPMASEAWDANYRAPATMHAAGVQYCFGVRSHSLAKLAPIHAGFAIAHGLDADAAVRALTLSAAEILGVSDQIGSIESGKLANLIVTTDHPCQATNVVKHMFIRGKPVSLESEHTRDAEKFANRPHAELPPARQDLKGPPSQSKK